MWQILGRHMTECAGTGARPELPDFAEVRQRVAQEVSRERFQHILRVVETADTLARRHGVQPEEARLAALLHDALRDWPAERLLRFVAARGLLAEDPSLVQYPILFHGLAAVFWSRQRWQLPGTVLAAVAYHTAGHPQMDAVAQTLYVADYAEPARRFATARRVRAKARRCLAAAVLAAADGTVRHVLAQGRPVHPQLLATRNHFLANLVAKDEGL